jgi:hypothetical protein
MNLSEVTKIAGKATSRVPFPPGTVALNIPPNRDLRQILFPFPEREEASYYCWCYCWDAADCKACLKPTWILGLRSLFSIAGFRGDASAMQPEELFHPSLMGYFPKVQIPFVWVLAGVAVEEGLERLFCLRRWTRGGRVEGLDFKQGGIIIDDCVALEGFSFDLH